MPSSSITRSILDAGINLAPGGTWNVGNRREDFLEAGAAAVKLRRTSPESTFPNRSPEMRDKWSAAW
jgi:hypothetical protein